MLRKILFRPELNNFKQTVRCIGKRAVKIKNEEEEEQQPGLQKIETIIITIKCVK